MSQSVSELETILGLKKPDGADVQAGLLRTLTDLYIQKPSHSLEEERHFTELALRLIEVVDIPTRLVIAQRLHRYGRAPQTVLAALEDRTPAEPALSAEAAPAAEAKEPEEISAPVPPHDPHMTLAAQSAELTRLFFDASPHERELILHNLEFAPIAPATPLHDVHTREAVRRLEVAALARNSFEFATILVGTLGIAQTLAERIARDPSGEPLIVAARALAMPSDILQRIILFLNPEIGHSVQRVYDLVRLHDEIAPETAMRLLAIWRNASASAFLPRHQSYLYNDEPGRARMQPAADARRAAPRPAERTRRGNIA